MKEPPIDNESQPLEGAYRIAKLIAGYIQGKLSPKEHDELDEWVAASDENMKLFEELTDEANVQKNPGMVAAHRQRSGTKKNKGTNRIKTQKTILARRKFCCMPPWW